MDTDSEFMKNFEGRFLQPQILFHRYVEIETTCGTEVLPVDFHTGTQVDCAQFTDQLEGKPLQETAQVQQGYLARMSAPGYLDCTSWSAYETKEGAMDSLVEMFGND